MTGASQNVITVEDLRVTYGAKTAVGGVSFTVAEGESAGRPAIRFFRGEEPKGRPGRCRYAGPLSVASSR